MRIKTQRKYRLKMVFFRLEKTLIIDLFEHWIWLQNGQLHYLVVEQTLAFKFFVV